MCSIELVDLVFTVFDKQKGKLFALYWTYLIVSIIRIVTDDRNYKPIGYICPVHSSNPPAFLRGDQLSGKWA